MALTKIISFFALSGLVFLSACKSDETVDNNECKNTGSFTVDINGFPWAASDFNNTLLLLSDAGVDGKRMDIRAIGSDGQQLIISLTDLTSGQSGKCVSTTATYTAFDDVMTGTENTFFITIVDENGVEIALSTEGTLDITNCNESNRTVSGTFSFETISEEFTGANGSFSNVCYRIIE